MDGIEIVLRKSKKYSKVTFVAFLPTKIFVSDEFLFDNKFISLMYSVSMSWINIDLIITL